VCCVIVVSIGTNASEAPPLPIEQTPADGFKTTLQLPRSSVADFYNKVCHEPTSLLCL
jgi:hypothetical protein